MLMSCHACASIVASARGKSVRAAAMKAASLSCLLIFMALVPIPMRDNDITDRESFFRFYIDRAYRIGVGSPRSRCRSLAQHFRGGDLCGVGEGDGHAPASVSGGFSNSDSTQRRMRE